MTPHPFGWLSLLPPIVALTLAITTRRIVFSLIVGIFAGALLMAGGDPLLATYHTWETHLWRTLIDPGKLRVFSFTIVMGAMIGVITKSGGMRGLIQLVSPWAHNRQRGQLATWFLGLLIFFDDYANTILLGSTLRPICDRLKISREKLAYMVDSTAAPVAGLAPLSTWVAVEIDYIGNGLEGTTSDGLTAFGLFLSSIPYRFYILTALLLVPITALLRRDIGPMVAAERRAIEGADAEEATETGTTPTTISADNDELGRVASQDHGTQEEPVADGKWYNAVLPILLTLACVVYFINDTGSRGACMTAASSATATARSFVTADTPSVEHALSAVNNAAADGRIDATRHAIEQLSDVVATQTQQTPDALAAAFQPRLNARDILGEADSSLALQYGAIAGLCLALLLPICARQGRLNTLLSGAAAGARVVLPAVAILWTASAMSKMTTDKSVDGVKSETAFEFQDHRLYTADYLTNVLTGDSANSPNGASAKSARISVQYLPTVVFLLAGVVAFCTGTSWGTMGILVPMVVQIAHAMLAKDGVVSPNDPILLSSIGGVLAGAVFGDHCSPISDTTVLSSQSSGCDHLAHVWTQMPYALLAAGVSILLGTLPIGFGVSVWILLPLQLVSLVVLMRVFGKATH